MWFHDWYKDFHRMPNDRWDFTEIVKSDRRTKWNYKRNSENLKKLLRETNVKKDWKLKIFVRSNGLAFTYNFIINKMLISVNPVSLRAMMIGPTLMAVSQFSGTFLLVNYAATIFKESGSDLNPNLSSIILGCLQITGTISTYFLVDRIGRRILLTISSGGAAIGLIIMGIYCYLSKHDVDVSQYNWIPVITLSFVIYISSIGIIPIPYIIISEVLPPKVAQF